MQHSIDAALHVMTVAAVVLMHLRMSTGCLLLLQAGVQKLIMNGRLRVSFKPLLNSVPIIAAIQVRPCLLECSVHGLHQCAASLTAVAYHC